MILLVNIANTILTMNIFLLSIDMKKCVQMYVNKHVVKMILEHTQILFSVHHVCGSINEEFEIVYKLTHKNHPCNVWARKSLANYMYLIELTLAICEEYTYRYGKVHKCEAYVRQMKENLPILDDIGFTIPAQAMPDEYKNTDENITFEDVIESYRKYYINDKKHIFAWKGRDVPDFVKESLCV